MGPCLAQWPRPNFGDTRARRDAQNCFPLSQRAFWVELGQNRGYRWVPKYGSNWPAPRDAPKRCPTQQSKMPIEPCDFKFRWFHLKKSFKESGKESKQLPCHGKRPPPINLPPPLSRSMAWEGARPRPRNASLPISSLLKAFGWFGGGGGHSAWRCATLRGATWGGGGGATLEMTKCCAVAYYYKHYHKTQLCGSSHNSAARWQHRKN